MASIQGIYLAFFGRPADPAGLAYWEEQTQGGADLSVMLNALAGTEEYQARFEGMSDAQIITSIYQSLFNRDPEPEGLTFFLEALAEGTLSLTSIAVGILDGAQGDDLITIQNKEEAANQFTASLDTPEKIAAYVGDEAAQVGRDFISQVTSDPQTIPSQEDTQNAVNELPGLTPDEGQAPGGGGGGGAGGGGTTFTVALNDDGDLVFGGNATGDVKFIASENGGVFERQGVQATFEFEDDITALLLNINADGVVLASAAVETDFPQTLGDVQSNAHFNTIVVGVGGEATSSGGKALELTKDGLNLVLQNNVVLDGGFDVKGGANIAFYGGSIVNGAPNDAGQHAIFVGGNSDVDVYGTQFRFEEGEEPPAQTRAIESQSGVTSNISVTGATFESWVTGIYVQNGNSLFVEDSTFKNNTAGIGTDGPAKLVVINSTFDSNGEGIGITAGKIIGDLRLDGNVFSSAKAVPVWGNGADFGDASVSGMDALLVASGQSIDAALKTGVNTVFLGDGVHEPQTDEKSRLDIDMPINLSGVVDESGIASTIKVGEWVDGMVIVREDETTLSNLSIVSIQPHQIDRSGAVIRISDYDHSKAPNYDSPVSGVKLDNVSVELDYNAGVWMGGSAAISAYIDGGTDGPDLWLSDVTSPGSVGITTFNNEPIQIKIEDVDIAGSPGSEALWIIGKGGNSGVDTVIDLSINNSIIQSAGGASDVKLHFASEFDLYEKLTLNGFGVSEDTLDAALLHFFTANIVNDDLGIDSIEFNMPSDGFFVTAEYVGGVVSINIVDFPIA